jgi:putative PIN family toxin of toxin-antitoxin system
VKIVWYDRKVDLVISLEILDEYQRVAEELAQEFSGVDVARILDLLTFGAEIVHAPPLPEPVCSDPEDDKFLACAVAGSAKYVVTGDKQLLKVSRHGNVEIVNPRWFIESHLGS